MKLNLDSTRPKLEEGRASGIGFAFCKKINDNEFTEIMPLSACKDYLTDAVVAEKLNKKSTEIYGFIHEPQGIFEDEFIYLSTGNTTSSKSIKATKIENINNCINFIHKIEDIIKVNHPEVKKTELIETDEYPILKIDPFWTLTPYLMSAYGLFFRESVNYSNELPVKEYVETLSFTGLTVEVFDKFINLVNLENIIIQEMSVENNKLYNLHNNGGIINYKYEPNKNT